MRRNEDRIGHRLSEMGKKAAEVVELVRDSIFTDSAENKFQSANGVMAGSVATLAILWISFQGMGFIAHPSFIDAHRFPIALQNHLTSYTGLPSLAYRADNVINTKMFVDTRIFPNVDKSSLDNSLRFGQMQVDRLSRLETNIDNAGITFSNSSPTHFQYLHWYPNSASVKKSMDALVSIKASTYLAQHHCQRFGIKSKKCAQFVSTLSMDGTSLGRKCMADQHVSCDENSKYRTIDGTCNNLESPRWGSATSAYSRVLFPHYADGIQEPRCAERRRRVLPNPRVVSTSLSSSNNVEANSSNTLAVMQWSQFVAHDLSHTPERKMVTNDKPISCCRQDGNKLLPRYIHPDCTPISIPNEDPIYADDRVRCMNYVRSMPTLRPDCNLGPAEQMNQVSHYLDGSMIYGSTWNVSEALRSFEGGKLRSEFRRGKEYLPTAHAEPTAICNGNGCYDAGDVRVNFMPQLTAMHVIWLREHNRVAKRLAQMNPLWNDEILYQEARRIVIAEVQHITYNEWLPVILGPNYDQHRHLFTSDTPGHSTRYNSKDNPSVSNEVATAALQFFNSLVQGKLRMHDEERTVVNTLRLSEYFNKPQVIEESGALDGLLRGLTSQTAQQMDFEVVPEMRHQLFKTNGKYGLDAISLHIQRGRDHGIAGYNYYREYCGLPLAKTFDDFLDYIPIEVVEKLSRIYDHPNDVDLLVGGTAERPADSGLVGPTLRCLISEQFSRSRRTDRFFYDLPTQAHPFARDQLAAVRNVTLARIFCDNGDNISSMQPRVFSKIQPGNDLTSCNDFEAIPSVDLFAWAEKAKAYR